MTVTLFMIELWARDALDPKSTPAYAVDCENAFFDCVFHWLDHRKRLGLWNAIEDWNRKATTEERISFALACVRGEVTAESHPWIAPYMAGSE